MQFFLGAAIAAAVVGERRPVRCAGGSVVIERAPAGLVALQDMPDTDDFAGRLLANQVICLRCVDDGDTDQPPFEAWVIFDGQPMRADDLPQFAGFGWSHAVVGAVPGAGWKVDGGEGAFPVEAWAIRADGSAAAVVVLEHVVRLLDPDLEDVHFVPPGWRKGE